MWHTPQSWGPCLKACGVSGGVIATLTNGSGLSEWDLAEDTPGTDDGMASRSGCEQVCFRWKRVSMILSMIDVSVVG